MDWVGTGLEKWVWLVVDLVKEVEEKEGSHLRSLSLLSISPSFCNCALVIVIYLFFVRVSLIEENQKIGDRLRLKNSDGGWIVIVVVV